MNAPTNLLPPDYGFQDWMNQASRLVNLRQLGFQPNAILDIGAYNGHWGVLAKHIWPAAKVLMIEANEDCTPQLDKALLRMSGGDSYAIALLDSTERKASYHKCTTGCGEGNGLFKENSVFPFETMERQTQTLNSIVGERTFDFVKLDCQGAEIKVLEGGWNVLRTAQIVQLETQVQDYNEGAPRIDEVMRYMGDRGFRLYDIADFHHNSRQMLIQVDLLFARQDSPLFTIRPLS